MKSTSSAPAKVRIGIIGTGGMAGQHMKAYAANPCCSVVAAADVDSDKVREFAGRHGIPKWYSSAEDLLANGGVDAVSVVVPDQFHAAVSSQCLRAGKHVLCEKPLAADLGEARAMARLAAECDRVNLVNFKFRNMPAILGMHRVIADGCLGELRHVEGSFLQSWLTATLDGGWQASPALLWRLSSRHGSMGVLGDVGVHIIDLLIFLAGPIQNISSRLKAFSKAPDDRIGDFILDANDSAVVLAEFANGALGVFHSTRWSAGNGNKISIRISGTEGSVEFDSDVSQTAFRISAGEDRHRQCWSEVECPPAPSIYDRFIGAIQTEREEHPSFADGVLVQAVLDACLNGTGSETVVVAAGPGNIDQS